MHMSGAMIAVVSSLRYQLAEAEKKIARLEQELREVRDEAHEYVRGDMPVVPEEVQEYEDVVEA